LICLEVIMDILICLCLGLLAFQDFTYRAVHIVVLSILFFIGSVRFWLLGHPIGLIFNTLIFIIVVLLFLWVYISIKTNKVVNPLQKHLGLGDILFFLAVSPLFSVFNYMLYFISGMILSIVFSMLFLRTKENIPLAGILSTYLLGLKVFSFFTEEDLFFNPIVYKFL